MLFTGHTGFSEHSDKNKLTGPGEVDHDSRKVQEKSSGPSHLSRHDYNLPVKEKEDYGV